MKACFCVLFFILVSQFADGQSWQWGIRGGGGSDIINYVYTENVTHIATDKNNNVYALSGIVYSPSMIIDGHTVTLPSNTDATLLFSYKCDGTFRWAKVLHIQNISGLATDSLGGVYVAGNIGSIEFFMGSMTNYKSDTSFNIYSYNYRNLVLVKLDTLGNKQWIRLPQPDTVQGSSLQAYSMGLDVEKNGTIHWLCELTPGNYQGSSLILNTRGIHVLRYSANGSFTGNTPIGLIMSPNYTSPGYADISYSKNNNRYIITGAYRPGDPPLTIGGNTVNQPLYVASFDGTSGNFNWLKQGNVYSYVHTKAIVDNTNNIYLTAELAHGYTFNGFTLNNKFTSIPHMVPFIQKMDANGNAIWSHGGSALTSTMPLGITLSGTNVSIAGSYGSKFRWDNGTDSFYTTSTSAMVNVFATSFNANTGNYVRTDTLTGNTAAAEYPSSIAADQNGNLYIGGMFEVNIVVKGIPLSTLGGIHDFFLAKFGTNNCSTSTPNNNVLNTLAVNTITIYPNPAADMATIDLGREVENVTIRLRNITGEIVIEKHHQSGDHFTLDVSKESNGIYIVEVLQQNNVWRSKFTKM